jgi:hypothetical protein
LIGGDEASAALLAAEFVRGVAAKRGEGACFIAENVPAPDWLMAAIRRHDDIVSSGRGVGCPEAARDTPQVLHTATWAPGMAFCTRCATSGALTPGPEAIIGGCDRCPTSGAGLYRVTLINVGVYVLWIRLCGHCHDEFAAEVRDLAGGAAGGGHTTTG